MFWKTFQMGKSLGLPRREEAVKKKDYAPFPMDICMPSLPSIFSSPHTITPPSCLSLSSAVAAATPPSYPSLLLPHGKRNSSCIEKSYTKLERPICIRRVRVLWTRELEQIGEDSNLQLAKPIDIIISQYIHHSLKIDKGLFLGP